MGGGMYLEKSNSVIEYCVIKNKMPIELIQHTCSPSVLFPPMGAREAVPFQAVVT